MARMSLIFIRNGDEFNNIKSEMTFQVHDQTLVLAQIICQFTSFIPYLKWLTWIIDQTEFKGHFWFAMSRIEILKERHQTQSNVGIKSRITK